MNEHVGNVQNEINVGDFIQKYGNNMVKRQPLGGFGNELRDEEEMQESSIYESTFENELSIITESTLFNQLDPI